MPNLSRKVLHDTSSTVPQECQILYSARHLIGSRIIESVAYCNQNFLVHLYLNSTQHTSVNCIILLLLSVLCRPKVILLSGVHCTMIIRSLGNKTYYLAFNLTSSLAKKKSLRLQLSRKLFQSKEFRYCFFPYRKTCLSKGLLFI